MRTESFAIQNFPVLVNVDDSQLAVAFQGLFGRCFAPGGLFAARAQSQETSHCALWLGFCHWQLCCDSKAKINSTSSSSAAFKSPLCLSQIPRINGASTATTVLLQASPPTKTKTQTADNPETPRHGVAFCLSTATPRAPIAWLTPTARH